MSNGPKLIITRVETSPDGALGVLSIGGTAFCWTLQPDPTDKHFFIPEGEYDYKRFHGTKHPDTFEIVVPGHIALLFHSGNTEDDTEGCIILGSDKAYDITEKRCVIKSRFAFNAFMDKLKGVTSGRIKFINTWE